MSEGPSRSRRKRVVQALASEDVRLLDQLEAGIVVMDGAGVVVRWNAHVEPLKLAPGDEKAGVVAVFWADAAPTTVAAPTVEVDARLMVRLEMGLEQERHLTAQLETLMGLTLLPQGNVSEAAVAHLLLERIGSALGADSGCVLRENGNRFRVVAQHKVPPGVAGAFEAHPANAFHFWRSLLTRPSGGAFRVPVSESTPADPELDLFNRSFT